MVDILVDGDEVGNAVVVGSLVAVDSLAVVDIHVVGGSLAVVDNDLAAFDVMEQLSSMAALGQVDELETRHVVPMEQTVVPVLRLTQHHHELDTVLQLCVK